MMIDSKFQVRRYISEVSDITGELHAEYELSAFDLEKFQKEFGETNPDNPMFDSYPIKISNIAFLKKYINEEPKWEFSKYSYFVETHGI